MKTAYLVVYNSDISRDTIKAWADTSPRVETWMYDMPHTMYVVSESSAADLAAELERVCAPKSRYFITPVTEDCQGRMIRETWHFLIHKTPSPELAPA